MRRICRQRIWKHVNNIEHNDVRARNAGNNITNHARHPKRTRFDVFARGEDVWHYSGKVGHRGEDGEDTNKGTESCLAANEDTSQYCRAKTTDERRIERISVLMGDLAQEAWKWCRIISCNCP